MFSMISGAIGIVGNFLKGYQSKQKATLEMKMAEIQNKARLLSDIESHNHAWEMADLLDKDKWLRRVSFIMFSSPFIIAIFAPQHVEIYFDTAIKSVPIWWQKTFMAITGGIWGISSLKNIALSIVNTVFKK